MRTEADTIVNVHWRGKLRSMYFQDGPFFLLDRRHTSNVIVLATYTNGKVAALITGYGKGKVGVSGPHPEATAAWYEASQLINPEGICADLGYDLIDTLMSKFEEPPTKGQSWGDG